MTENDALLQELDLLWLQVLFTLVEVSHLLGFQLLQLRLEAYLLGSHQGIAPIIGPRQTLGGCLFGK